MLEESTPTDTGCLLTAQQKAVTLPWGRALNGVFSFIILNGDSIFWHYLTIPSSEDVVGYYFYVTIPLALMYWKACHCHPPSHPLHLNPFTPQQSVNCWSEQLTPVLLCFIMYTASKAPVAEKAQQLSHTPCILTSETHLFVLQSTDGLMSLDGANRYYGTAGTSLFAFAFAFGLVFAFGVVFLLVFALVLVFVFGFLLLLVVIVCVFALAFAPPNPVSSPPTPDPNPFNNPFTGLMIVMF